MERNPFTKQGKALSCDVREIIVEKWLEGSKPFQIAQRFNLPRKTVSDIVDRFVHTGSVKPGVGGNRLRTARTDDVVLYTEFCKRQRPSMYAAEVQKQLIENQVVLPANVPSQASISRVLASNLGYSYKKMTVVPKESLTDNAQERLDEYLTVCSTCDPRSVHFFDESSVIKTTGNRNYGHAPVGQRAVEIQRYASNATYTVNLLHSIFGVDHVNILPGPSNGLELHVLNFFAEALQEQDIFGNPLLKQGDLVIMDNCGFHHARHVEPVLRNMLGLSGVDLVFQLPYHLVYNTCEHCGRFLKSLARPKLATSIRSSQVDCLNSPRNWLLRNLVPNFPTNFATRRGKVM